MPRECPGHNKHPLPTTQKKKETEDEDGQIASIYLNGYIDSQLSGHEFEQT